MNELTSIIEAIRSARAAHSPLMLATLVRVEGSSYRQPGARLLMDAEGPRLGSLSGGCLEADVFARASECLVDGKPRLLRYDLRTDLDLIWGTGSGCEGAAEILVERLEDPPWLRRLELAMGERRPIRIAIRLDELHLAERVILDDEPNADVSASGASDIFVETFQPPIALWIFGASDDARPLVRMAETLGFFVGVVDHRSAFARADRFPEADVVKCLRPASGLVDIALDGRSAAVLMTHHFEMDRGWLEHLLPSEVAYLGLMGHRRRSQRLLNELEEEPSKNQVARLFSPVGLDLGSESPEAIALSILAEIQAVFSERQPQHLRDGRGAIHAAISR